MVYVNNKQGDKNLFITRLCELTKKHQLSAEKILPLISVFGEPLESVRGGFSHMPDLDFRWEREWRYGSKDGSFQFERSDVLLGLCPIGSVAPLEKQFSPLKFIDPRMNMDFVYEKFEDALDRWYEDHE